MRSFLAALVAFLAISANAYSEPRFSDTVIERPATISGSKIVVYSLLLRWIGQIGPGYEALDREVAAQLEQRSIETRFVHLMQSGEAVVTTMQGDWQITQIPIEQIVDANRAMEREFGAAYRLIILPTSMRSVGSRHDYEVQWLLVDVPTDQVVWRSRARGRLTASLNRERAGAAFASELVSGAIEQMTASGLFAVNGSPPSAP